MSESRRGFLLGVAAYGLWGAFPLYWPLLEPAGAIEILAHRMLWSVITMGLLVLVFGRWPQLVALVRGRRTRLLLSAAAFVIAFNWVAYIWGVNNGHVVEASPRLLHQPAGHRADGRADPAARRLRRLQWAALGLASVAVVVLTVDYGRPPWVALVLAFSFGTYGLAKKQADAGAVESLAFETARAGALRGGVPRLAGWHGRVQLRRPTASGTRCCSRPPAWSPRCR